MHLSITCPLSTLNELKGFIAALPMPGAVRHSVIPPLTLHSPVDARLGPAVPVVDSTSTERWHAAMSSRKR